MDVKDTKTTSKIHSIEWGNATWDSGTPSIRNRYDNAEGGRFNYAGSAEIPWEDFKVMIQESINRNHFTNLELGEIMDGIANKLKSI